MSKAPSFIQKLQARDKAAAKHVREKLGGEDTIYMGDPSLNWTMGGWVRGRCNLIYGPSGSGKTGLALKGAGAEQQKSKGWVWVFDSEYAHHDINEIDEETGKLTDAAQAQRDRYAKADLDPDMIYQKSSNQANTLFGDLGDLEKELKKDPSFLSAIVVDSWGGIQGETQRKRIEEGKIVEAGNQYGGNAKTVGPTLQTLLRISAEYGVTMFFVQHCIANMEEYGPRWLLIGGQKLRFLVHGIMFVESVAAKDASLLAGGVAATKDDDVTFKIGKRIRGRCEKSRKLVEGRKCEFWMNFEDLKFALPEQSLFNLATSLGVISHPKEPVMEEKGKNKGKQKIDEKTGEPVFKENVQWWQYPVGVLTPTKWHGAGQATEALRVNQDLFNTVYQECLKSNRKDAIKEEIGDELGLGEKTA